MRCSERMDMVIALLMGQEFHEVQCTRRMRANRGELQQLMRSLDKYMRRLLDRSRTKWCPVIFLQSLYANVFYMYEEYNERLSQIDEPLRMIEIHDKIFHELFGEDGHGYCLTYGSGVPRSAVYQKNAGPSEVSFNS
ncbi:hypothetical protein RHGRI_029819 [Rhododendron griersonianum]|uniref:Uncharacterized protein n=1 Tax=Rhododendron griersonianum TaxID=479676 RepID=A0AAV6IP73_9ERIC|nr:hypothetical protein RHGRI_029819 [Rhododendron griersonianum]